jgi:hypothetical protein
VHRGVRLGVVLGAERLPDLGAFGNAVLRLRFEQGEGRGHLAAASGAEDAGHDRGGGDDVGDLPARRRPGEAERDVLAGVGDADGVDVLVDPVDPGLDVLLHLHAVRAVALVGVVELLLQVGFVVRRGAPELLLELAVPLSATGEGRELPAAEVAEDVHHEQPVLRTGVSGTEHRAGPRGPGDVRDPARLVTHDRDVRAGLDGTGDVPGLDPERGVVEVRRELVVGDPLGVPHQLLVRLHGVTEVRRPNPEPLEQQEIRERRVPVLPRRHDVGTLPDAVVDGRGCLSFGLSLWW